MIKATSSSFGRPSKSIDANLLKNLFRPSRNINLTKVAAVLGVHRNTLSRKIREIGCGRTFSQISNDDLDLTIREYRQHHPKSGASYVTSYLRDRGIRVQRRRVREALARVDGVGVRLRTRTAITRRAYTNPRPMAVWHGDGHLKAIMWGIALHGFIDGYSRKVCFVVFVCLRTQSNHLPR